MTGQVRTHTDAVLGRLKAVGLSVGDGAGDGLTGGYVVLYGGAGDVQRGADMGSLGDPDADLEIPYRIVHVGRGREEVNSLIDRVRAALLRFTPTVAGRVCMPMWQSDAGPLFPPDRDDPSLATFSQTVEYTLRSNPA